MRVVQDQTTGGESQPRGFVARALAAAALVVALVPAVAMAGSPEAARRGTPTCAGAIYTVVANDSWSLIASRAHVTLTALLTENAATTATALFPGMGLCLPLGAATPVVPPTTVPPATVPPATVPPATVPPATVPTPTTAPGAATTTTTPSSTYVLAQFPVQGPCFFVDTWGAPRSGGRSHEGVDLIAHQGQWIYAATNGTLTKQYIDAPGKLSGNGWRLTAVDGTYFFYGHLSTFAPGLQVGSAVVAGQIIGQVGSTGSSSTPHLHFEVHPGGGAAVNPTPIVKAVDGCKITAVPAQPAGVPVPSGGSSPTTTLPKPGTPPTTLPSNVPPAPAAEGTADGGQWRFVGPTVALDTGWTGVKLAARTTTSVPVTGLAGISADADAVVVRIGTRNGDATGWLLVHPCDAPLGSSTLNFSKAVRANGVAFVRLVNGAFCVTASQSTDVRIDVIAESATDGIAPMPIVTTRAVDTRASQRLAPGTTLTLSPEALGVPAGTSAVSATITVIDPSGKPDISYGPCGSTLTKATVAKQPLAAFAIISKISSTGLCVSSSESTQLLVDVSAAWVGSASMDAVNPTRVFDARNGAGTIGTAPQPIQIAGVGGIPADATSAVINITIVGGNPDGVVFAYQCGSPRPAASVAATSLSTISAVSVAVSLTNGAVCVSTLQPVPVVVDVIAAG